MEETKGSLNGTFSEWCDFCNTITDHIYTDNDCEAIKCIDCGLEE